MLDRKVAYFRIILLGLAFLSSLHCAAASEPRGCTVITVSQGDRVFFIGNDDYTNRDSTYWVASSIPLSPRIASQPGMAAWRPLIRVALIASGVPP